MAWMPYLYQFILLYKIKSNFPQLCAVCKICNSTLPHTEVNYWTKSLTAWHLNSIWLNLAEFNTASLETDLKCHIHFPTLGKIQCNRYILFVIIAWGTTEYISISLFSTYEVWLTPNQVWRDIARICLTITGM